MIPKSFRLFAIAFFLFGALPSATNAQPVVPVNLRCESIIEPLGIDTLQPGLSWQCQSYERNKAQSAYRILVASSPELLKKDRGDLWDSGKVASDRTTGILYEGKDLLSSQRVFWKVRLWDEAGKASRWSPEASWTLGLLEESDWQAKWISSEAARQGALPSALRYLWLGGKWRVSPESYHANEVDEKAVESGRFGIGYHAPIAEKPDEEKWVQVDLGDVYPISEIRLHPMQHQETDGFGFPVRFKIELSDQSDFTDPILVADYTREDYPNPGYRVVSFDAGNREAQYVRVTATKIWKRKEANYCFALKQLEAISEGKNVARFAPVTAKDSVESREWAAKSLTDDIGLIGQVPPSEAYASMLLRKSFPVLPGLSRAVAHVCGLGHYEMTLNGAPVTDHLLLPGWTLYNQTCQYDTFDIASLLHEGDNAAGLFLGNGMYNSTGGRYSKFVGSFGPLKAIAQIRLEYSDGTVQILGTDASWKTHAGPITFSCVYGGEDYDARLEQPGWDRAGFDDSKWDPVLVVQGPGGNLRGQSAAACPIGTFEVFPPIQVNPISTDTAVYDLGQNASMMPRLRLKGPAGSSVLVIPSELIHEDGTVDRSSCGRGSGDTYWKITLDGRESLDWFPRFFYVGCRYLQVQCVPAEEGGPLPTVERLEGVVVHSEAQPIGRFACSNELFNRIQTLIRWAQRSNMVSVLTDCPHREKLGWLEQSFLNGPALRYEFDLDRLFSKILNDISDSQLENGLVPDIAPEYVVFEGGFRDSPEWGSAVVIVPWQQYEWTGNPDLLRRHYDNMKRYLAYLGSKSTNYLLNHGLGDWYDIGPNPPGRAQLTPISLTATAFYFHDAKILAQAASLLGYEADAKEFSALAEAIRAAFNKEFFQEKSLSYSTHSQCANAIPLAMRIVPPEHAGPLFDALVKDVEEKGYITGGDVGYPYILMTLANRGRSDLIYGMTNQSDRPGYGYILAQGATSLTESWVARRSSSQNHFMLGHINEWFYSHLAGIRQDPDGVGFRKIRIQPEPVGDLTWARGAYDSIHGRIASEWKIEGDALILNIEIPANTTATVAIPCSDPASVLEGGKPIAKVKGIRPGKMNNGALEVEIGSGVYRFQSRVNR